MARGKGSYWALMVGVLIVGAVLFVFFSGIGVGEKNYYAFVPNAGDGTVSVIDIRQQKVIDTIKVGEQASHGLTINPRKGYIYSGDLDQGSVVVIDAESWKIVKTITVGKRIHGIDLSPDGKYLYVGGGFENDHVTVIDTSTHEVVRTITHNWKGPSHVEFSPDSARAYVPDTLDRIVSVIDTAQGTVIADIKVGKGPNETRVSPDGKYVYSANIQDNSVSVIDTEKQVVIKTFPAGVGAHGIAVSPDGRYVWIANRGSTTITVFDAENDFTRVATIEAGKSPNHLAFVPDQSLVWATLAEGNEVVFINPANYQVVGRVAVGTEPHEIDFLPASRF